MASKIKKKVLEELQKTKNVLRKAGLEETAKYALLEGLYNQVDKQESDTDVVNTVWANKDLPLRMFTEDEFSLMPGMKELMIGEPRTGEVNLDKSFGPDWRENFNKIPYNQIALVAEKNGVSTKDLMDKMTSEIVKKERHDIANSGVPGFIMSVFGRRQKEAIERGEDPSGKDIAGDIGEGALYAVPYGRALGFGKNLVARHLMQGVASNVAPPLASEVMDNVLYDEKNPRGNFSVGDVGSGVATNLLIPALLRRGGTFLARNGLPGKSFSTLGEGLTPKEMASGAVKDLRFPQNLATQEERELAKAYNSSSPAMRNVIMDNGKGVAEVASQKGNTLEEKAVNYIKSQKKDPKTHFVDERGKIYEKWEKNQSSATGGLYEAYDNLMKGIETAKSPVQLASEESFKNLVSNKFGDQYAEGNNPVGKIPLVGNMLQKNINDQEKIDEEIRKRKEIEAKYFFDVLKGVR